MKKILTVSLTGLFMMNILAGTLQAQKLSSEFIHFTPSLEAYIEDNASAEIFDPGYFTGAGNNEVKKAKSELKEKKLLLKTVRSTSRASENFKKNFSEIPDAAWTVQKEAIVATFFKQEVRHNIVYDGSGRWIRNISYLSPVQTPKSVIRDVSYAYPAYKATSAVEIEEHGLSFHIVTIENEDTIRWIVVGKDDMNIGREWKK